MSKRRYTSILWRAALLVLFLGIAAGSFFWLSQSGAFAIKEIDLEGNRVTGSEEIMDRAAPLLRGQSLLKPSFSDVESVVASLPYIEGVEVERDFPDRVRILVREHRPFLCLNAAAGKVLLLSADGKALAALERADPAYPALTTREPCEVDVGGKAACPDVLTGISFLANIPVSFNQEFAAVTVAGGDISARTRTNVNVRFGTLEEYGMKFEVLRQLIARSAGAGAQLTIDISVPDRPVTKQG